ncbi:hypothetical protein [Hamadaea tsunoensis]|uniref:hypothetical protein n=1 Tax=Hamadaea tsunoensis TaxID=53368 RepID=UPI0004197B5C|nr:hypothetical protein [Hamadaea tsunoensis]
MSEVLLDAGAILPGGTRATATDTVTARAYRHPVLDGRTVVRLVGAAVGPAEDLTMEFLGFAPAAAPVPVGVARRQALGFPAWALVHDPANGRHALALVKEMEKLARVARSKPGNARDGYEELAGRLGAAAPQFLPTFWEQAGRAFVAADNQRMAGSCFTDARRAEQVHGLVIDEERVRDVHLEFAFAGALTATMLGEYARGVSDRRPAAEAYQLVKTLALRRVAGGLAPHASMAADLARLAKAAGLDAEKEADAVVGQLLGYPAMGRAHPSVWKSYRRSLVRLGKRDAEVRGRLLAIVPEPPGWRTDMTDEWLELLEACGAAADLVAPAGPGSASRWLERMLSGRRVARAGHRNVLMVSLVERMAPRLIAEGGVELAANPWGVDLDILDVCLAAGVPVRIGSPHNNSAPEFNVASWAIDTRPGRRDLAPIAADPVWRPALARGVRAAISRMRDGRALTSPALADSTLREAFGAPGVQSVLIGLIEEQTTRAGGSTVVELDHDLTELAALWSPAGMALAPAAFRRLMDIDVPAVLARSLRAGLPAELGWPGYEEVARPKKSLRVGESWPELVLHDEHSAHVVAPDGQASEHVFRYPPNGHPQARAGYSSTSCWLVDGELRVGWSAYVDNVFYWASRPDERIEGDPQPPSEGWGVRSLPLAVAGGGVTTGGRPMHAGDSRRPGDTRYPVVSDGQAFWRCEFVRDSDVYHWRWREFDPRTGEAGRISEPSFFAAATSGQVPGTAVVPESCELRPAPAEFAGSPLGWRDGLVGWRVVRTADGTQIGEGLDGRRVEWRPDVRRPGIAEFLVGALMLPGATAPLPLTRVRGYGQQSVRLWTADGRFVLAEPSEPTSTLPPLDWWHALRPRDEAGSAALRALDEVTAAALMAVDDEVTGTEKVKAAVAATVAAHLPAVTDAVLRDRIVEVVSRAVRLRRRIATVAAHLEAVPRPAPAVATVSDEALRLAWDGLTDGHRGYYHSGQSGARYQTLEQISQVAEVLAGATRPAIPGVSAAWTQLLAGLGAVAMRAAAPSTTDADRTALAALLAEVAGTPLSGDGPPLRVLELIHSRTAEHPIEVTRDGDRITVMFPVEQRYVANGSHWRRSALQVSPDGTFAVPEGFTVAAEARVSTRHGGARLREFCALLAERGPAPWRPAAAEQLAAATGMTRAEAILLLAGLPGIAMWEANFLTAEQRGVLGITATHAKVARASLQELTPQQRVRLLDAALPVEPADLWEHGPDVDAVAQAWIKVRGRRVVIPEDLVADLARVVDKAKVTALLQAITAPSDGDLLSTDGRSTSRAYYELVTRSDTGEAFDGPWLCAAAIALPWLAYRLSWDDPLRAALAPALALVRARLRNPDLLVGHGVHDPDERPDIGPALVDGHATGYYASHHVAPAQLTGPDDPALGFIDEQNGTALRVVLSGWIDDVVSTPDGAHGDPHDPAVSAPGLVTQVRERFGLDDAAAAYYLQLLALPDPTDKAVLAWNGWKPAQLKAAQAALAAADLVVAAKRERAGRPVFLPGGWQPAKAPRHPVEAWKQPFYLDAAQAQLVTLPLPRLFTAAWDRVVAGDVPRYLDLASKP